LKTDPKARYQGYTFYFREGFCWNNILNPEARLLKVKLKGASVNDVGSMSFMPIADFESLYFIALLNSNLLFDYYRDFINCSVNIQINDLRQLPIIIANRDEAKTIVQLAHQAVQIKKDCVINELINANKIEAIEQQIEQLVEHLYFK
jgi:hypothetical protein